MKICSKDLYTIQCMQYIIHTRRRNIWSWCEVGSACCDRILWLLMLFAYIAPPHPRNVMVNIITLFGILASKGDSCLCTNNTNNASNTLLSGKWKWRHLPCILSSWSFQWTKLNWKQSKIYWFNKNIISLSRMESGGSWFGLHYSIGEKYTFECNHFNWDTF